MVYVMSQNELYHHGILGMKWGKRQGPPYPLDGKQHSAAEKKAGWQKSLDKASSRAIAEKQSGKRRIGTAHAIKKALNKTDDAVIRAIYDKQVAENLKVKKLAKDPIADVSKYDANIEKAQKIIAEGEKRTWQLMADSAFAGYTINSQKTLKMVNKGNNAIVAGATASFGFIGGMAAAAAVTAADAIQTKRTGVQSVVEGNKFKVKKAKPGETTRISIDTGRAKGAEKIDARNQAARERIKQDAVRKALKSGGNVRNAITTSITDNQKKKIERLIREKNTTNDDAKYESAKKELIQEAKSILGGNASQKEITRVYNALDNLVVTGWKNTGNI